MDERRDELHPRQQRVHFTPSSGNRSVEVSGRRGAAADAYGNVYWIDETGTGINVHSAGSRESSPFWSCALVSRTQPETASFKPVDAQSPQTLSLAGLAVTTLHYLVVGTIAPAGLLVFDLHRGGEPRQLLWPVEFAPFDLVATTDAACGWLDAAITRVASRPARWRLMSAASA